VEKIQGPRQLYTSFQFEVGFLGPASEGQPQGVEWIPLMAVYMDPFTDLVWLGRALRAGEPTLKELLDASHPEGEPIRMEVWMLPRWEGEEAKVFRLNCAVSKWNPLDLDASHDDVAMEWVGLKHGHSLEVRVVQPDDVPDRLKSSRNPPATRDLRAAQETKKAIVHALRDVRKL